MGDFGKTVRLIEEMRPEVTSAVLNLQENVFSEISKMNENRSKFALSGNSF